MNILCEFTVVNGAVTETWSVEREPDGALYLRCCPEDEPCQVTCLPAMGSITLARAILRGAGMERPEPAVVLQFPCAEVA